MSDHKVYFRPTTAQQRHLLFQIWEQTNDIDQACQQARVSRRTFYYWKGRFEEGGYEALEETHSTRPKQTRQVSSDIEGIVISLKKQNPSWGKKQIAVELASRSPTLSISPNTVRRILIDAALW